MATYKIPQNVEAEDKLLGPFSFKQFIYLMVASFAIFITWLLSRINVWLIVIPSPVIVAFAILGIYHREDQPVETYLLAAINFLVKPRRRKWNPEGITENVKITAPKKKATPAAKHLERGQLEHLAHVVDTRGWYVKRPELQEPIGDNFIEDDDRLINPAMQVSPQEAPVHEINDMLSAANPEAEEYQQLAETTHSQAIAHAKAQMKAAARPQPELGIRNQELGKATSDAQLPVADPQLPASVHYDPYPQGKLHTLDPTSGHYGTVEHATPATPLVDKGITVAEHAKAAQRQDQALKAGRSASAALGGEAELRAK